MIFKLFNKKEKFIGEINNAIEAIETKQTRGVRKFDFILPADTLTKQIEKYFRIIFQDDLGKWREYIVNKVITRLDYQGAKIIIQAEDFTYELRRKIIEDKRPTNTTANIAAEQLFMNTRIEVGNTEDLGLSSVFFYRENKKEAFNKLLDAWDCEYDSYVALSGNKITHRYVDLVHRLGEFRGKRYEYSRDLKEVQRTVQSDDVYTALYGFGKGEEIGDGYGRRINFENVEWKTSLGKPLNKPLGQRYIADDSLVDEWGVPDKNGNMTHSFGIVTFDDIEEPNEVLEETYKAFLELSQPRVKYSGKVIDLNRLMGMNYDAVSLGDEVLILDLKISGGILIRARVLEYKKDWLNPSNDIITLGNYSNVLANKILENEKQINKIRDKSGAWDKADFFDKDGLPSQYLKNLIDELNNKMNTTGGYTYFREGKGIEILNKPEDQNPTESMMLGGGYIAIADTKKANGEWDYKTFGTGTGFTADLIRTGLLKGGKVEFDLTNGTLLIGNSIEDYSLLFDGNNLSIKMSDGKTLEQSLNDKVDSENYDNTIAAMTQNVSQNTSEISQIAGEVSLKASAEDLIVRNIWGINYAPHLANNWTVMSGNPWDGYTEVTDPPTDLIGQESENYQLWSDKNIPVEGGLEYTLSNSMREDAGYVCYTNIHFFDSTDVEIGVEGGHNANYQYIYGDKAEVTSDFPLIFTAPDNAVTAQIRISLNCTGISGPRPAPVLTIDEVVTSDLKLEQGRFKSEYVTPINDVNGTHNLSEIIESESVDNPVAGDLWLNVNSLEKYDGDNWVQVGYGNVDNVANILKQTQTELKVLDDGVQIEIDGIKDNQSEFNKRFSFQQNGMTIGEDGSPLSITIDNDRMSFYDGGVEVAYVEGQEMNIENAIIKQTLQVGNHKIEKYDEDTTVIRYVGVSEGGGVG